MTRVLDTTHMDAVAQDILDALEDMGYDAAEAIPGAIRAIQILAEETSDSEQALDEAAGLLA